MVKDAIYKIIKEKNYKQSAIAKAAGYDVKTFNNMVKGRKAIYADDILNICRVLCVSADELYKKAEGINEDNSY